MVPTKAQKRNAKRRGDDYERKTDSRCEDAGLTEGGRVKRYSYGDSQPDVVRGLREFKLVIENKKRDNIASKTMLEWADQAEKYLDQYAEWRLPVVLHEDTPGKGKTPDELAVMRGAFFWEWVAFTTALQRKVKDLEKQVEELGGQDAQVCARAVRRANGGKG